MKVRIFEEGIQDHGGLTDIETEHLPSAGDIFTLQSGTEEVVYKVLRRVFRADGNDNGKDKDAIYYVALVVELIEDADPRVWLVKG